MKNTKKSKKDLTEFLDEEEKELIESYERGEWKSDLTKKGKSDIEKIARYSLKKNKRINIRISEKDYNDLKIKAIQKGIPYQSLISTLIHQYNKGEINVQL